MGRSRRNRVKNRRAVNAASKRKHPEHVRPPSSNAGSHQTALSRDGSPTDGRHSPTGAGSEFGLKEVALFVLDSISVANLVRGFAPYVSRTKQVFRGFGTPWFKSLGDSPTDVRHARDFLSYGCCLAFYAVIVPLLVYKASMAAPLFFIRNLIGFAIIVIAMHAMLPFNRSLRRTFIFYAYFLGLSLPAFFINLLPAYWVLGPPSLFWSEDHIWEGLRLNHPALREFIIRSSVFRVFTMGFFAAFWLKWTQRVSLVHSIFAIVAGTAGASLILLPLLNAWFKWLYESADSIIGSL